MRDEALPEQQTALESLRAREQALEMPMPAGKPSSPVLDSISGEAYTFEKNDALIESVKVTGHGDDVILDIIRDGNPWSIEARASGWNKIHDTMSDENGWARCTWTDDNTLVCRLMLEDVIGTYKFVLCYKDDAVSANIYPTSWTDFPRFKLFQTGFKE